MEYTPAQKRLKFSAEQIMTRADHDTAIRINKELDAELARNNLFGSASHGIELARIVGEELDKALPRLFAAYNAERSKLHRNGSSLNVVVRRAIDDFVDGSQRHAPSGLVDWGTMALTFEEALSERHRLASEAAEEHFRHPGLSAWPQRHPVLFAAIMAVFAAMLALLARKLWA